MRWRSASADGRLIACSDLYAQLELADARSDAAEYQSADGRWLRRTVRDARAAAAAIELIADVTELRRAEQAARFLALPRRAHRAAEPAACSTTACARRSASRSAATAWCADAARATSTTSGRCNDTLGHGAGDAVLREVARAPRRRCVRKADTLARAGADEFALVVCDLQGRGRLPRGGRTSCSRRSAAEFRVGSRRLRLGGQHRRVAVPGRRRRRRRAAAQRRRGDVSRASSSAATRCASSRR